jgi:hypothetical protein
VNIEIEVVKIIMGVIYWSSVLLMGMLMVILVCKIEEWLRGGKKRKRKEKKRNVYNIHK